LIVCIRDQPLAVINNSFSFFQVIFFAIGVIVLGLIFVIWVRYIKCGILSRMSSLPAQQGAAAREPRGHDVRLRPFKGGPLVSSFGENVMFCAGWNAIMWTMALVLWFVVEKNEVPWFAWLTIVLFLAVGLYLIINTIMMSMARVKLSEPTLTASVHPLRPNESFQVRFSQRAKQPVYVERVAVRLVCRKSVTYHTGGGGGQSGTTTDSHDLYEAEHEIAREIQVDSHHPIDVSLELQIPENGMHTSHAPRNRIDWLLEVCIAMANWPDYTETFELKVN